ncbi:MAG TPA: type II secretion system protein N [Burkholderiales bacterium]|nr:type II secretion system protein N [Burkholderiales bacterium]
MTRARLLAYCAVGALAYLIALAATLPAAWISRALERASAEKLLVRAPEGTLWTGRARVYARERSGPPLELGELRWKTAWSGVFAGKLATDVTFGNAGRPVHLELSPFGVTVQALDVSLPAKVLSTFVPGLETVGPEGVLRLRSDNLRVEDDSILGLAEVEWRQVRFSRAPGLDLGSHVARLRGGGSKVDIELGTLEGPLRLSGSGMWDPKAGFKGAGAAEHGAQVSPELPSFLRAMCPEYRNNRCGFRFALQ